MTHSLIAADRRTHCKIVALALALSVVMLGITANAAAPEAPTVRSQAETLMLMIGKLGIASIFDAAATR
jgi:hypothetical protein